MDEKTLKEYAYGETAGQNKPPEDAPQSGETPDMDALSQDVENQSADAPPQYGENQNADTFSQYSENASADASSDFEKETVSPLNFGGDGNSDVGGSGNPEAASANEEQNGGPETPPGYGNDAGPGTPPPGYGQQAGPGGYRGNNWQNGPSGAGSGSGPQGYGPGAPPNYGKNNWQGTPPPGYGYGRFNQGGGPYNGPRKSNNMALASLILGILSIVLCCCGGFGVILGAVGIVLAILSRGSEPMETSAKVGLGLSIGGIVLGILVLIMSFAFAGSDQFRNELNRNGYGNYESYRHYFEHGGL